MKEKILVLAEHFLPECVALRRKLHTIPELAGKEFQTSALLREKMSGLPLEMRPPYLETDVTALLNYHADVKQSNITLRADMDALPIQEETQSDHVSLHPGVMHACGHDGHMSMLYGAMRILCVLKDLLPEGSVRFAFQPGEEVRAMAKPLIAAGALDNPVPNFCAALHDWPVVKYDCISTRVGAVMAAAQHFELVLRGRGGHGSMPELAKNPIQTGARIVEALRKNCPPVCSVCKFQSGRNSNIIDDNAYLAGTTRWLDDERGAEISRIFHETVESICREDGVEYELTYTPDYPVCASTAHGYDLARAVTEKYLGEERFVPMARSSMSSEDFAYFLQKAGDGVFCHLGLGNCPAPLHSSRFEFDDNVLKTGMIFLAGIAVEFLKQQE